MTAGSLSPAPSAIVIHSSSPKREDDPTIMVDLQSHQKDVSGVTSSSMSLDVENGPAHVSVAGLARSDSTTSILRSSGKGCEQKHQRRRSSVQFHESLVTDVRERPYTAEGDKELLHYSAEDMQRFRREARIVLRARAAAQRSSSSEKERDGLGLSSLLPIPLVGMVQMFAKSLVGVQPGEVQDHSSSSSVLVDSLYLF